MDSLFCVVGFCGLLLSWKYLRAAKERVLLILSFCLLVWSYSLYFCPNAVSQFAVNDSKSALILGSVGKNADIINKSLQTSDVPMVDTTSRSSKSTVNTTTRSSKSKLQPLIVQKPLVQWRKFRGACPKNGVSMTKLLYGCSDAKRVYSDVPLFTAESTNSIIRRYRSVIVMGDSLARHVFNALMILNNGDVANGALRGKYSYFPENISISAKCRFEGLFREKKKCLDEQMAWDNVYGDEMSPRVAGCPASGCSVQGGCHPDLNKMTSFRGRGNMILFTWYSAKCSAHALEIVSKLTFEDAVILGVGIHDNFNFDAFQSYVSEEFLNISRRNKVHLLVLKAVAAGKRKPRRYVNSQGTGAAKIFNTKLEQYFQKSKIDTVNSMDMTLDADSHDGTHYGLDVNFMRASQVLNWLKGRNRI
jgi:hypothetical protein